MKNYKIKNCKKEIKSKKCKNCFYYDGKNKCNKELNSEFTNENKCCKDWEPN